MARRLPGVQARLEQAAVELFATQGFAATTGKQIAERAGTTERTFYRHFGDKADAAFGSESELREELVAALEAQPIGCSAWSTTLEGLSRIATLIEERPDDFRLRTRVVAQNAALRNRELARAPEWVAIIVPVLTRRGTDEATAHLCAVLGLAMFRVAAARWTSDVEPTFHGALVAVARSARDQLGQDDSV